MISVIYSEAVASSAHVSMVDAEMFMFLAWSDIIEELTNLLHYLSSASCEDAKFAIVVHAIIEMTQEFFLVPLSPLCMMKMVKSEIDPKTSLKSVFQISVPKINANTRGVDMTRGQNK